MKDAKFLKFVFCSEKKLFTLRKKNKTEKYFADTKILKVR